MVHITRYVFGLDLNMTELPTTTSSGYPLNEIGLIRNKYACKSLSIQVRRVKDFHEILLRDIFLVY